MDVLCSPSWPVLANSACYVEHPCHCLLNFLLQYQILLPGVKSSDSLFLRRPHSEMFENSIKNNQIFIVSFLKVVFDLIRIISLSHETVCNWINLIVSILSDWLSDVLDIYLVPVFFLIDIRKCFFKDIQFHSFDKRRKIMKTFNKMSIPLP